VPVRDDAEMTPLPPGADVVVVGGGLVGASLAYELVTAGASTVLIDRHDPGRATDAGAGILSPETNQDPDPGSFAFGLGAIRHYEALLDRLDDDGVGACGYSVTGLLMVSQRPGDDEVMDHAVDLIQSRTPGTVEEIEAGEALRLFPPLGPVRRALFNPSGRRIDGRVLNAALREAAVTRGLRLVDAGVTGFAVDAGRASVRGVVTSRGTIPTDAVVIAGGAWSAELGRTFGVNIPVAPLKGQIVHLSLPATDSRAWPIVQPVLGFYLVPWPDGRVACGGTMEAAEGFDHRPTADGMHQLLRECLRTAPGMAQATVLETRVGSRPSTPDQRPVLGRIPGWDNAFLATGHGAEGLLLGPFSGRIVAALVLGTEVTADPVEQALAGQVLDAHAIGRFA
jgi:D-amino-acid dehydrogenase